MTLYHACLVGLGVVVAILGYLFIKGATQDCPDWLEEEEFQLVKRALAKEENNDPALS